MSALITLEVEQLEHVEFRPISMKTHSELNEAWLQGVIEENPALLGLGELDLVGAQIKLPEGGLLDLLLEDPDTDTRYEVELQLGGTDPSHIIRTLEYWDIVRNQEPHYDHVAVLVAEEITRRFFNVIRLFNRSVPIVAIQVTALQVADDKCALVFTRVLDRAVLGTGEGRPELPDRDYWENEKSNPEMMELADLILADVAARVPGVSLNYNKWDIGLVHNGVVNNFVKLKPQQKAVVLLARIPRSEEWDARIKSAGIHKLGYVAGGGFYQVKIPDREALETHTDLIKCLIDRAKP